MCCSSATYARVARTYTHTSPLSCTQTNLIHRGSLDLDAEGPSDVRVRLISRLVDDLKQY